MDAFITINQDNPAALSQIAGDLTALLSADVPKDVKLYACRKLAFIGTAENVDGIAPLLADDATADMARLALERIPGEAATKALRDALASATGARVAGLSVSVGRRGDEKSVRTLAKLAAGDDAVNADAAIAALALIGTRHADRALAGLYKKIGDVHAAEIGQARLRTAEHLKAAGKESVARRIYRDLADSSDAAVKKAAGIGLEGLK